MSAAASSSRPRRAATQSGRRYADYEQDEPEEEEESSEEEQEDVDGDAVAQIPAMAEVEEDDTYARLQGAVAKHRQVAALASGERYDQGSSKSSPARTKPLGIQKKVSQARIEAIANVNPPEVRDSGWMAPPPDAREAHRVFTRIMEILRGHIFNGRRVAESLESYPDDRRFREKAGKSLLNLVDMQARVSQGIYSSSEEFEIDMMQMFKCFRRGAEFGTQVYGDTCILQRLYQQLTRVHEETPNTTVTSVDENYTEGDAAHHFSSVPEGPDTIEKGQNADVTTRPVIRGKVYYTHAIHKGQVLRVGDWIHMINPQEVSKPIIAQIFKICKREDEMEEPPLLSVCWYLRPEQTIHPPSMRFSADEVLKTGLFADHTIDDVLEKCYVMFYTKWTRGRPPRRDWDPSAALYITEYRFNEKTHEFNKIKNWNSCLPEELRGDVPMELFDEIIAGPPKLPSPFLRGIKGPGRLSSETASGGQDGASPAAREIPDPFAEGSSANKRRRVEADSNSRMPSQGGPPMTGGTPWGPRPGMPGPTRSGGPLSYLAPVPSRPDATQIQQRAASSAMPSLLQVRDAHIFLKRVSVILPAKIGNADYYRLYSLFSGPNAMNVDLRALCAQLRGAVDVPTLAQWRSAIEVAILENYYANNAAAARAASAASSASQQGSQRKTAVERTMVASLGGLEAYTAELSAETVALFGDGAEDISGGTRDAETSQDGKTEVNAEPEGKVEGDASQMDGGAEKSKKAASQVRWFAAPPLFADDVAGRRPTPSLDYLYARALKAKTGQDRRGRQDRLGKRGSEEVEEAWKELVDRWTEYHDGLV